MRGSFAAPRMTTEDLQQQIQRQEQLQGFLPFATLEGQNDEISWGSWNSLDAALDVEAFAEPPA